MKTLEELKAQEPVYLHNWEEKIDLIGDFEDIALTGKEYRAENGPWGNNTYWEKCKSDMAKAVVQWEGVHILFASYGQAHYKGDAFVLFEEDGKLYEVNGGHCSCFGLEGQWEPEETTIEAIADRLTKGTLGKDSYSENEFADELASFLGVTL